MSPKKNRDIPEGWKNYSNIGLAIPGTKFLPFKTPLKEETCSRHGVSFSTSVLLGYQPKLKLIVDLTNTDDGRYYHGEDFTKHGVRVVKIKCPGGPKRLPSQALLEKFFDIVDDFLIDSKDSGSLIGVHCTHGVNRTGYFICKYMTTKLKIEPEEAIKSFQTARGHPMERKLMINDILQNSAKSEL